ncbi:MAG: CvpA family protein [Chitinophagaceae bacterium]|nr:CvpA family protein [Chitinophagaceae bacterium]
MIIDLILAALLVIACIKGYQRGLVIALFSILAFIAGLAAALKLSTIVAGYLQGSVSVSAKWLPFLSFVLVFAVVVLLIRLGAKLIEKSIQIVLLGWLNRLGGILFYAALYLIIFSIFLFYAEKLHLVSPSAVQSSLTAEYVQPWGPKVINGIGSVIPFFKDMFIQLENFFQDLPGKVS